MKRFKRILVSVDSHLEEHPIVKEAAELALLNDATLTLVDVAPDFPWTTRFTLKDHQHLHDLMVQEKQEALDASLAQLRQQGVQATSMLLHGKTALALIRQVLRQKHDLVFRVAKGTDDRRGGFFDQTGIRLLRKCPCAVWLVSPSSTAKFEHVLGAVDTESGDSNDAELNDKVFELASSISKYHGGRFSIAHAWSIWNHQMLLSRMSHEDFSHMEQQVIDHVASEYETFLKKHGTSLQDENIHLIKGEPAAEISQFTKKQGVDLLVMGTVARSGVSGMLMGNTAEQILSSIECSVLALKPDTFVCPVGLEN